MGKDKIHKKNVVDESKRKKRVDESNRPRGFVTVNKDLFWWFDTYFHLNKKHEFSREEAMLWLLFNASYKNDNGIGVGELRLSLSFCQTAFRWKDSSRVERFFKALEKRGTIERVGEEGDDWHIRIKNWSKNQKLCATPSAIVSATPSAIPSATDNSLINTGVTDRCATPSAIVSATPSAIPSANNYNNNIDSSPVGSSSNYSNKTNLNNPASQSSAVTAAASEGVGENAFGEKDKGQVPSGQSGLYQPQPVQAPEFQMTQQPLYPSDTEDYFTLKDVYDCMVRYLPEGYKLDKAGNDFIKSMFFSVRNKAFTKQNGGIWSALDLSEWLAKLLGEKGYPVVSPVKSQPVQAPNTVQPPFTFEDVLSKLDRREWDENIEYLKERYDSFSRKGFVTSSGEKVTLSFFTGFLLEEARKATGKKKRNLRKSVPWTGWEK